MAIDDATKRRLIYVKKLYFHGHEHISHKTEFDRLIAIHHLDNAVELLLKCVATQLDISFSNRHVTFPELLKKVNQKCILPKKTEILQLHDFRSNVQHLGLSPLSSEVVIRFDVYVSDFIREVMEQVFELNFEELFMSSLIEDVTLRKILKIAEVAFEKKDYKKCLLHTSAAFSHALELQRMQMRVYRPSIGDPLGEIIEELTILKLGINYRNYLKYREFEPRAIWDEDQQTVLYPHSLSEVFGTRKNIELETKRFSKQKALFCLNFVINCILSWKI